MKNWKINTIMNKLLFISFFFIFSICYAQKFENIGIEKGLSSHQAYNIVQDYNGFIWVSTKNGIDRYNGETISNYNLSDDNKPITYGRIKLTKDTKGNVWAFTAEGYIYKFIEGKNRFELEINIKEISRELVVITHLVIEDVLWISTDKGLYKFDYEKNNLIRIPLFENQKTDLIFAFDKDKLLVALSDHLVVFNSTSGVRTTILQKANKAKYSWIRSIFWDKDTNEVWVGTRDGEVYVYNFITSNTIGLKSKIPQLPSVPVNKIVSLQEAIYIGSDGGGVFKISKKEKALIKNFREDEDDNKSLTGNGVQDLIISNSNNLLVSTFTGGLNILDNRDPQFRTIRHEFNNPNSLRNNVVNSLLEDEDGDMWFATNNGVSCWLKSENKWVHYLGEDKNNANVFLSLFQYDGNSIMAGSYSKGLYVIDKNLGVIKNILPGKDNPNNSDPSDYIVEIFRDIDDKIWTGGTFKDLAIYNPKSDKYNYLPIISVKSIKEKDDDHIFIGTQSGLFIVNIHTLSFYKENFDGFIDERIFINSLNYDKQNNTLWVATSGNGIIKWNLGTKGFNKFSKKNGMPSNHVYAILKHGDESVWASTESGLIKYNIKTNSIESFSIRDGLSDESFYKNSKLRDQKGNFYFGSYSGVTYFNPDDINPKKNDVKLYFENFLIDNRIISTNEDKTPLKTSLNKTEQLNLDYNQNSFSFNFTSIIKLGTSEINYSWMLDNQDADWTIPSLNNNANYTNLSEGDYVFKLRAIGNKNDEILDERKISVHINAAPWNTLWARLIYFILFSLILVSIIRYNINYNKKKLSEAKVKFFINTAHDIRTPLTLASAPLTDLHKSKNLDKRDKYHLNLSMSSLNQLTESIDHLLDFQKSDLGKIRLILSEVDIINCIQNKITYFGPIAIKKNIQVDFICEVDTLVEFVDLSKFDKLIDNLLSNAFKYTNQNGSVTIRLTRNSKNWIIEIIDTGIGISKEAQESLFKMYYRGKNAINSKITGTGIGLLLARDYVQLHKGKIDFESKEGFGTKFIVSFLNGKAHYDAKVTYLEAENINPSKLSDTLPDILNDKILERAIEPKNKKLKLFIVEDNDRLREYLEYSLGPYFKVKSAENGELAINMILKDMPDIIVSDVGMPKMNGIELTNLLKSKYETSHIPIILLTAFKEKDDILSGLQTGADDYITKPFDNTILLARIENILKNRKLVKSKFINSIDNTIKEGTYANKKDQEFVVKAIEFVESNITNANLTKQFFAREMSVSETLLYKKIKTLTDQSPVEFIRTIRLKNAAKLLREGEYSINEIANLSGFSDSKYFSTCFKKFFGKSPSHY